MPTTDWKAIPYPEMRGFESNHKAGKPPLPGYRPYRRDRISEDLTVVNVCKDIQVYVNWVAQPPPITVGERCAKCNEHIHDSIGVQPPPTPKHAPNGYWLERLGLMYKNTTIRGTELRRTFLSYVLPDGSLQTFPFWDRREVDEIRDGIEWFIPGTPHPCIDGEPFTMYASATETFGEGQHLKKTEI